MKPLLLDTLVLLWWLAGDSRFHHALVHRIKLPKQPVYVSVVSAWEICALEREGQVTFEKPARDCLPLEISVHRFAWLPIDYRHVFLAQQLPRDSLDSYDRLILAQAAVEGLALATTNDMLRAPGVEIVDARSPYGAGYEIPLPSTVRRRDGTRGPKPGTALQLEASKQPGLSAEALDQRPIPAWNAFPWGGTTADTTADTTSDATGENAIAAAESPSAEGPAGNEPSAAGLAAASPTGDDRSAGDPASDDHSADGLSGEGHSGDGLAAAGLTGDEHSAAGQVV